VAPIIPGIVPLGPAQFGGIGGLGPFGGGGVTLAPRIRNIPVPRPSTATISKPAILPVVTPAGCVCA